MWDVVRYIHTNYGLLAFAFAGIFVILKLLAKNNTNNKFLISANVVVLLAILSTIAYFLYLTTNPNNPSLATRVDPFVLKTTTDTASATSRHLQPKVNIVGSGDIKNKSAIVKSSDQYFYLNADIGDALNFFKLM
jgi:hypothetical protein